MKRFPVLINGFLYYYDLLNKFVTEVETGYKIEFNKLTQNEAKQVFNCIHYQSDRERVNNFINKFKIKTVLL